MKNEPREAVSGLKTAGVIALLASLLVLLPSASAGSYAMKIHVEANPSVAAPGEHVEFIYNLTNTGDYDLYNIVVDGLGEVPDLSGVVLKAGDEMQVYGNYTMGDDNAYNSAFVTAQDYKGRPAVRSYSGCAVMLPT